MGYLENLWNALDFGSLRDMVLRLVSVFLCLTVHETCHGLAALALGDPTAKRARRLSLNPLRHIDWFGLLMMITVGFGWAKPVPVDPRLVYDYAPYSAANQRLLTFLLTTAILSLGLGLFNLIPIPPLDGSKVLFSLLPDRAYNTMLRYERYGMLLLWAVVLLGVGDRWMSAAIQWTYELFCRVVGF